MAPEHLATGESLNESLTPVYLSNIQEVHSLLTAGDCLLLKLVQVVEEGGLSGGLGGLSGGGSPGGLSGLPH